MSEPNEPDHWVEGEDVEPEPSPAAREDAPKKRKPYKFTPRRREQYLQLLREGYRRGAAALAINIDRRQIIYIMHDDAEFARAVDEAEMEANENVEDALYQAATSGNVTACQVWLYNRNPGKWADRRNLKQEISGPDGGPVPVHLIRIHEPPPAVDLEEEATAADDGGAPA